MAINWYIFHFQTNPYIHLDSTYFVSSRHCPTQAGTRTPRVLPAIWSIWKLDCGSLSAIHARGFDYSFSCLFVLLVCLRSLNSELFCHYCSFPLFLRILVIARMVWSICHFPPLEFGQWTQLYFFCIFPVWPRSNALFQGAQSLACWMTVGL